MSSQGRLDILRWASGQRLAQRRIAREARTATLDLAETLDRIDELRELARSLNAKVVRARAARENLAFHRTFARLRRAHGFG
jgi:uncharacterized coiled-coil DUF342 family protein